MSSFRGLRTLQCAFIALVFALVAATPALAQDAAALRARYTALQEKFASNQFGRPLWSSNRPRPRAT